jgi:hypothetical protein
MGVLLWIVSKLLTRSLRFPFLFHTIADGIRYGDFWKRINETFLDAAYAEDVYGNTTFRSLLNALFTQKGGYLYGHKKETVSSATGKGQVLEKQTILGEGLAGFLAMLQINRERWLRIQRLAHSGTCQSSLVENRILYCVLRGHVDIHHLAGMVDICDCG